jgi:hypothetical protein
MSWTDLLSEKRVEALASDKAELDGLRSIVDRCFKDIKAAQASGLSHDQQFIIAYDAARNLSTMIVRASGYRAKQAGGYHRNIFAGLEAADSATFKTTADYFQICRVKRNDSEYSTAGGVTGANAHELVKKVTAFAAQVEAWIGARYPTLKK